MEREIRLITPEHIEDYLTIYLNAYPAYKNTGEEGRDKYRPRILHSMEKDKNIHFYGLFEDGKLIAQMKVLDFTMNAFGRMVKATGLMALGVHPMHKKKGAARDMVKFFEEYTRKNGAVVAMLLPFRMDFYRKMGYGYGSKMDEYRLPSLSLPEASKEELAKIEFLGWDEAATAEILACHTEFAGQNHGMLCKFEDEIRALDGDSETRRAGYYEDGILRGYAAYRVVCESDVNYTLNRMEVDELVYLEPKVLTALLGFLRNQSDLAQTVVIRSGEPDFYHILPSAQDTSGNYMDFGFLQTNLGAVGTMYKIVDPAHFIRETSHRKFVPADITARFVYDDEFEHCAKNVTVNFGPEGQWNAAEDGDEADVEIRCTLAELSSLFMGSCSFSSLVRMGAVTLSEPGYEEMLDMLFYYRQKPWTNTDY